MSNGVRITYCRHSRRLHLLDRKLKTATRFFQPAAGGRALRLSNTVDSGFAFWSRAWWARDCMNSGWRTVFSEPSQSSDRVHGSVGVRGLVYAMDERCWLPAHSSAQPNLARIDRRSAKKAGCPRASVRREFWRVASSKGVGAMKGQQ